MKTSSSAPTAGRDTADRDWAIAPVPVCHPDAVAMLRRYFAEMAGRYYGWTATDEEIDAALAEDPSDDLAPPTGLLLLARRGDTPVGSVGLRLLTPRTAELTRVFVLPEARRAGGGSQLLAAAEQSARGLGATTMRLDTRRDLI
ncbi:GNAT family N-acetyltransferase [Streptomyces sp. 8N706]|uniref:GNAT family N-acetyltransferase n=1 Tax=Streptomyces sp. 8N706 TaxID=3457416 RepID=UPI003FCF5C58